MNFTREPIIETIITPRDGYKLAIRNTKGNEQEEYFVDAVEVVSFGNSFFFRSLERPKPFLVPVSDFQVVEVKETRVVLKNAAPERAIKIGGGREGPPRPQREAPERDTQEEGAEESTPEARPQEMRGDKKRDRRRHRRRRPGDDRQEREWDNKPKDSEAQPQAETPAEPVEKGGGADDETQVSSSIFSTLFPPPPTLISESLSKYKEKDAAAAERDLPPQQVEKHERKDKEEDNGAETETFSRVSNVATGYYESQSFSTTHVYRLDDNFSGPSYHK